MNVLCTSQKHLKWTDVIVMCFQHQIHNETIDQCICICVELDVFYMINYFKMCGDYEVQLIIIRHFHINALGINVKNLLKKQNISTFCHIRLVHIRLFKIDDLWYYATLWYKKKKGKNFLNVCRLVLIDDVLRIRFKIHAMIYNGITK